MHLYLLRHGIAEDLSDRKHGKDSDRQLTPKGARKVTRVARAMIVLGLKFDQVLSSPYKRARQTGEIVAAVTGPRNLMEIVEALKPDRDFKLLIDHINACPAPHEHILLIGHEPFLSDFASLLISGKRGARLSLKKAGLCKIAVPKTLAAMRCGSLEWVLTPKQAGLIQK